MDFIIALGARVGKSFEKLARRGRHDAILTQRGLISNAGSKLDKDRVR
jgi:hypothetical protein